MIHKELIDRVAKTSGDTKTTVARVVDALVVEIQKALAEGDHVSLPGVGKFAVREAASRVVKSPVGGETQVPAKKKPKFTAAAALKRAAEGQA